MVDDLSAADLTVGSPVLETAALVNKLALRVVEERHKQFEAGEEWALLDAIDFCARAGIVLPEWAVDAFCDRYEDWRLFQVRTLDEAFKLEGARKDVKIKARANRERLRPWVAYLALRFHDPEGANMPIDEPLFERIGQELGIGKTLAAELYRDNPWLKVF